MRRAIFLLVATLCSCDEPVHDDPPAEESRPTVEELAAESSADAPDVEDTPPTDPEALAWWQAQRVSEQALTSGRLSHVQVADIRRRQRRAVPPEDLTEVWNIPAEVSLTQEHVEALGLLRICGSETEWDLDASGQPTECEAILQTISNIRARHCDNERFSAATRTVISQCKTEDGRFVSVNRGEHVEGGQ